MTDADLEASASPSENHTVVIAGFFRRDGSDFRGPDDFFNEERHMKNRKFLFRNKIQPINTEATTLELVIYGGSLPMIAEGFKWKDIELINSVKKSTTEQLSKSTTQRLLSIQGRFKSMVGFVEQFSHLEEVLIYIEVRETELHQVQRAPTWHASSIFLAYQELEFTFDFN